MAQSAAGCKRVRPISHVQTMPSPPPLRRHPPLLLRSAAWRLAVALALSAALLLLWRWALQGGAA